MREEADRAAGFFAELRERPPGEWRAILDGRPREWTEGLVRQFVAAAEEELNRNAAFAMVLLDTAERIVDTFEHKLARSCLGDIWKHRANALRHLGKYPESVDAASIAEAFYDSLPAGTFDAAQARYTRAVTLFKMMEYEEALSDLHDATETLASFGDSAPYAKALVLKGVVRFEQGAREEGVALWQQATPLLERFDQRIDLARVHANLAEYELSTGRLDAAEQLAFAAVNEYRALRMDAEVARAQWTLAMIALGRGNAGSGLRQLYRVAEEFAARSMMADAAFVKLDITEELVRRHRWSEAITIARDLVIFFERAGVTPASMAALHYLRTAVEKQQATPALVQYVRDYVTEDDPGQKFNPPLDRAN
jgi:tetratricopeptide (TPR) repeat protein